MARKKISENEKMRRKILKGFDKEFYYQASWLAEKLQDQKIQYKIGKKQVGYYVSEEDKIISDNLEQILNQTGCFWEYYMVIQNRIVADKILFKHGADQKITVEIPKDKRIFYIEGLCFELGFIYKAYAYKAFHTKTWNSPNIPLLNVNVGKYETNNIEGVPKFIESFKTIEIPVVNNCEAGRVAFKIFRELTQISEKTLDWIYVNILEGKLDENEK